MIPPLILYTNDAGDPCVKNWSIKDLRAGYDRAEAENDDILYLAIMSEFERRNLKVINP